MPELMQIGLICPALSPEECLHCRQRNLYLYCGEAGHYVRSCPAKLRKCPTIPRAPTHLSSLSAQATHLTLLLSFQLLKGTVLVKAIIDSGACSCFMDLPSATQQHFLLQSKMQGLSLYLADRSCIKLGLVTQETSSIPVTTAEQHKELLSLDFISSPLFPIILGLPWLQAHNPQIN